MPVVSSPLANLRGQTCGSSIDLHRVCGMAVPSASAPMPETSSAASLRVLLISPHFEGASDEPQLSRLDECPSVTKTQRTAVPVESFGMAAAVSWCGLTGVTERLPIWALHSVCGMAVPVDPGVWVNVRQTSPIAANLQSLDRVRCPSPRGLGRRNLPHRRAAKLEKLNERCHRTRNSPCFGSLCQRGESCRHHRENFDVLPTDNRDLRNSATKEISQTA